jgi:8-oxo-dGTP diphosphatase
MSAKPWRLIVKAIVQDDAGKCLLIRRSGSSRSYAGDWDLPGGKADDGERFDEALAREVAEETGLTIALHGVAGAIEYEMPEVRGAALFMEARLVSGDVCLSDEHDKYEWRTREELADTQLAGQLRTFLSAYVAGGLT